MKALVLVLTLVLGAYAQSATPTPTTVPKRVPMPEASTISILSVGLAGIGVLAWRRRQPK